VIAAFPWSLSGRGVSAFLSGFVALIFLTLSVLPFPAQAGAGTDSATFLDIPVGAAPAALGGAYTALANDAYAPTWNPAGLGFVDSTQIAGQHLSYLDSIDYEYLSAVHPFSKGHALGASVQYLGSGDTAGTDNRGDSIGDFSTHYAAFSLAYGQRVGDRLSLGLTGKMIDAKISDVSATAYAGDAGAMYHLSHQWTLAAAVDNAGTKMTFLNDGGRLPLAYKAGLAYTPSSHWTAALEEDYLQTGVWGAHFGLQWKPIELIALRAGYHTDTLKGLDATAGVSAGLGIDVWGQELAYAWVPYGDLGNTQYFSLLVRFGEHAAEKRNLIKFQSIKTHRTVREGKVAPAQSDPEYEQLMELLSDQEKELRAEAHTHAHAADASTDSDEETP